MKLIEQDTAIRVEPRVPATAAVIWMHGLGADGHDFVPLVRELGLQADAPVRFLFPHAPVAPVTLNNGFPMRSWFDILGLDRGARIDEGGLRASVARVRELIEEQRRDGVDAGRIVVAGFSQGGAVAMHTALRYPHRLAGLLALSTWLPLAEGLAREQAPENRDLPILMCHGAYDGVLPLAMAEQSRDALRAMGQTVEWQHYPMAHEVSMDEIDRIAGWLKTVLALG